MVSITRRIYDTMDGVSHRREPLILKEFEIPLVMQIAMQFIVLSGDQSLSEHSIELATGLETAHEEAEPNFGLLMDMVIDKKSAEELGIR